MGGANGSCAGVNTKCERKALHLEEAQRGERSERARGPLGRFAIDAQRIALGDIALDVRDRLPIEAGTLLLADLCSVNGLCEYGGTNREAWIAV